MYSQSDIYSRYLQVGGAVWGVAGGDGCGAGRYTALLVLSSCGREMFTCHRTGSCVPMAAR